MDDQRQSPDRPHDALFRHVLSDPEEAAQMLRGSLPETARKLVAWDTLTRDESSFVSPELRHSESDLLFDARLAGTDEPVQVCVLLEHQSKPDRWIRARLLDYGTSVWRRHYTADPAAGDSPSLLPVVLYQGKQRWPYTKQFADLLPEAVRELPWTPRFEHVLLDQTRLAPEMVAGHDRGRLVQLLLMAWARGGDDRKAALDAAGPLMERVEKKMGRKGSRPFMVYAFATLGSEDTVRFARSAGDRGEEGGLLMTYAEELRNEGREEGERNMKRERLATVEGMLEHGVAWDVVRAVTGVDEQGLAALRQQVAKG